MKKCIKCREHEVAYEDSKFCEECGDFMFDVAVAEIESIGREIRYQAFKHRQATRAPIIEQRDNQILLNT